MAKIPKQTKKLKFSLNEVPRSKRKEVREEIGKTLVEEIKSFTRSGNSPVSGEKFPRLSKAYADEEKGGNRTPNLRLSRDMVNSLNYKVSGTTVEVGVFDSAEKPKADGHNNFSGASKIPQRRFIPGEDQNFKKQITSKINKIIRGEKETPKKEKKAEDRRRPVQPTTEAQVTTDLDLGFDIDKFIIDTILGGSDGQ